MLVRKRILALRALVLLIVLFVLITGLLSTTPVRAASGAEIPTEGGTWTSSTIHILIVPQLSAPWFKSSYTFDVNHAVSRWSHSITAYTDIYGSNYLRDLSFVTCVSVVNDTLCGSPDIKVRFIESFGS